MRESYMLLAILIILTGCQAQPSSEGSPHGESVVASPQLPFTEGDQNVSADMVSYGPADGYLAEPDVSGEYPGVILIHEWWGLNSNIKATANKIASHGYTVLAVDLYNGKVANTSSRARELSGQVSTKDAMQNLQSAQQFLENQGVNRTASFGFCFGGDQSMEYAVQADGPDASVIYYGQPVKNSTALQNLDQPLFGAFGTDDRVVSVENVRSFETELDNDSDVQIEYYEGAGHAFANPSGDSFNETAASDAWNKTLVFLNESLRQ